MIVIKCHLQIFAFRFDELHYGKYAAHYVKNLFFFDSQPPLGKQLLAIPAYLAGFDGKKSIKLTQVC